MIDKEDVLQEITNTAFVIIKVAEFGYIPNSKKYRKLNNGLICNKLLEYNKHFNNIFTNNIIHYYNNI